MSLNGAGTGTEAQKTQAWVSAEIEAEGRFSVGFDALQHNNLTVTDLVPGDLDPTTP